ncbi:hypothetical protein QTL86_10545 [Cellulosilyticum sp. ST5]|uniref:hypothetical protein n=1 Tax=Cellulosilyticum sp. ST5 TaxID=3055805 RepID=UPI003977E05B
MKNLFLKKLTIVSRSQKRAKVIEFGERFTIFTSYTEDGISLNRTGKSLVCKCIYYALGAEITKYPTNWEKMKIATLVEFKIADEDFTLYREEDNYILNDVQGELRYLTSQELITFYSEKCNYNICLPIHGTDKSYPVPVSGLFLPFYLDQDTGWSSKWESFSGLSKYKNAVKELIDFHTGVHSYEYYKLLNDKLVYAQEKVDKNKELQVVQKIFDKQLEKYGNLIEIETDIDEYQKVLDVFMDELNKKAEKKTKVKEYIKNINREIVNLKVHIFNAKNILTDLEQDINFLEKQTEVVVICPICGTEHTNDMEAKYNLYRDKGECEDIILNGKLELEKMERQKKKYIQAVNQLNNEVNNINYIVEQRRGNISLDSIIESLGVKKIIEDLGIELDVLKNRLNDIEQELVENKAKRSKITREGGEIKQDFSKTLNTYLSKLEVVDEDHYSRKSLPYQIRSTGSDNPRGVLALFYAYFDIIQKNQYATIFPLVIDTPMQQDQGSQKGEVIMQTISDNSPANSQIIVATTKHQINDANVKTYNFIKIQELLNEDDYINSLDRLEVYRQTLIQHF